MGIAIGLGAIVVAAVLIWLGVKAYGRLNRDQGGSIEHEKIHVENAKAGTRFDRATSRPLSGNPAEVVRRYRARRRRRLGLLPETPPDDKPPPSADSE
jgi:hypothetical protein